MPTVGRILRRLLAGAAAFLFAPLIGWLVLDVLPHMLLELRGPVPKSLGAVGMLTAAGASAFALGFFQPRLWHLLAVVMAVPPVLLGIREMREQQSNIWPLGMAGLAGLTLLLAFFAYMGRWFRMAQRISG